MKKSSCIVIDKSVNPINLYGGTNWLRTSFLLRQIHIRVQRISDLQMYVT